MPPPSSGPISKTVLISPYPRTRAPISPDSGCLGSSCRSKSARSFSSIPSSISTSQCRRARQVYNTTRRPALCHHKSIDDTTEKVRETLATLGMNGWGLTPADHEGFTCAASMFLAYQVTPEADPLLGEDLSLIHIS